MLYFASVSVEHTMLYQGRRKRGGGGGGGGGGRKLRKQFRFILEASPAPQY